MSYTQARLLDSAYLSFRSIDATIYVAPSIFQPV